MASRLYQLERLPSEFASVEFVLQTATSGAPTADTSVKGLVEIATAGEVGSSTATGGSGATLVIPASIATDTPDNCTGTSCVVAASLLGKIKQAWLDLTVAFIWGGLHTFQATTTMATTTVDHLAVATTTNDSYRLQVAGDSYLSGGLGVGKPTTTDGALDVSGNFYLGGDCQNCWDIEQQTNANSGCGSGSGDACSVTASCSAGYTVIAGGHDIANTSANFSIQYSKPSGTTGWAVRTRNLAAAGPTTLTATAICIK